MTLHDLGAEWLRVAHSDYVMARHLFDTLYPKPLEGICFHCQQAVEKSLKAFLCVNDTEVPRTHATGLLCDLCAEIDAEFAAYSLRCKGLELYAAQTRYPNEIDIDEGRTERLLRLAQEIYTFVARKL